MKILCIFGNYFKNRFIFFKKKLREITTTTTMQWTTKKGKRGKEENVRGKNDERPLQHARQNVSAEGGSGTVLRKDR